MKHQWFFNPLKVVMITALLLSVGGTFAAKTVFASSCDNPTQSGEINVCFATGGAGVTVVRPTLGCYYQGSPSFNNIMSGCDGSNEERVGFGNYNGVQEWVDRYGWTYSGTGDNKRYFTYSNYAYFAPMDTSKWTITFSDGNEYKNTCYGGGNGCDYQAWQNYISDFHSPTAQFRDWLAFDRFNSTNGGLLAEIPLVSPQPGIVGCKGTQTGTITTSINGSIGVKGSGGGGEMNGSIGFTTGTTVPFHSNGECNATADEWSVYMNLNWGGDTPCSLGELCPNTTQSPLSYVNVTAFYGPNNYNGDHFFEQGWNLDVNWWNKTNGTITNYNLFGTNSPNGTFRVDMWYY